MKRLGILALGAALAAPVLADDHFYFNIGKAYADVTPKLGNITGNGNKIAAGFLINENWSIDGGVFKIDFDPTTTMTPIGVAPVTNINIRFTYMGVAYRHPMKYGTPYLRVGTVASSGSADILTNTKNVSNKGQSAALGVDFKPTKQFDLRIEIANGSKNGGYIISLGPVLKF